MTPDMIIVAAVVSVVIWAWVVRRSIRMHDRDRVLIALCLIIFGIVGGQFFALVKPEQAPYGAVLSFAAVGLLFLLYVTSEDKGGKGADKP